MEIRKIDCTEVRYPMFSNPIPTYFNYLEKVIVEILQLTKKDDVITFISRGTSGAICTGYMMSGLYNEGYSSFEEFKTNNYSINYAVKETIFNDYVIAILKQEEPYGTSEPIEPIEIEINEENEGETLKYVLANAPYSAKVKVVKRDKETEEIIAKSGVRFKIKWLEDENGNEINEYISQEITLSTGKKKVLEYFETDSDGTFITPEALKPGKYQLEEIRGVEGYILNEEALEFEIFPSTEGIELDEEYGLLLTLDFYNEKEVENPKTSDNTMYMVIGGIIVVGLVGAISYKKIKE